MKKFVRTAIFWAIGFCLFISLLGYVKSASSCTNEDVCCKSDVPTPDGGEMIIESLSRQFVSTMTSY